MSELYTEDLCHLCMLQTILFVVCLQTSLLMHTLGGEIHDSLCLESSEEGWGTETLPEARAGWSGA